MSDIFKDMQMKTGCEYISDLPSHRETVWKRLKKQNLSQYDKKQLEDFSNYVFGLSYDTLQAVIDRKDVKNEYERITCNVWKARLLMKK